MHVLVVGAGSIGRRHIRNLLAAGVNVSAVRQRVTLSHELASEFGIRTFASLEDALHTKPDAVVVCNRTDQHLDTALAAARCGCHLYIEKPVSHTLDGLDELTQEAAARALVVEVGCMLRFHPNLVTLKRLVDEGCVGHVQSAHVFVGQHLSEWRPGQDYRESYSASRQHGGGVLLDLVHEIDYLLWLLGKPSDVFAFLEHLSDLESDVEDTAELLIRFEDRALAHVHLDCTRPVYGRGCEFVGTEGILSWDDSRGTVVLQCRGAPKRRVFRRPADFERNAMFVAAMDNFLRRIETGGAAVVSLRESIEVVRVVVAAREAARERRVVGIPAAPVTAVTDAEVLR